MKGQWQLMSQQAPIGGGKVGGGASGAAFVNIEAIDIEEKV
jgi:hypothetical protein